MKSWKSALLLRNLWPHRRRPRRSNPPRLLIESFLVLIALGTLLLKTPWATHAPITWLEAVFTATSAVTVTGLTVVETGSQFTLMGQLVILVLIQFGGLGLMTFAVLTAAVLGFKIGLGQQMVAREAFNQVSLGAARETAVSIGTFALIMESLGLLVLALFFVPEKGWAEGLYHALFYAVSAFNNSGFALSGNSLGDYVSHSGVSLTVSSLFIIGGLGYIAATELIQKRRFATLSVYAKIIVISTLALNVIATLAFLALEYSNPHTLGALESFGDKLLAAWFQGTTPRTAGFHTLDISAITAGTSVLFLLLMFVGAAPNSTASGIKLSTFAVLLCTTRAFLKGNLNVTIFRRSIAREAVFKALALTAIATATVFLATLAIVIADDADFLDITFEVVSAFGTVGLSRGITEDLGPFSQIVLMLVMLIGRAGPLALGFMLTVQHKEHFRYARTEFPMG